MDADVRVAAMDAAGIGLQMISPTRSPTSRALMLPRPPTTHVPTMTRSRRPPRGSLGVLSARLNCRCRTFPAAIAVERSVRELGLVAAYIDTDIADRTLDALTSMTSTAPRSNSTYRCSSTRHRSGRRVRPTMRGCVASTSTCCWASPTTDLAVAALVFGASSNVTPV